jgi:hypothetical protein
VFAHTCLHSLLLFPSGDCLYSTGSDSKPRKIGNFHLKERSFRTIIFNRVKIRQEGAIFVKGPAPESRSYGLSFAKK